MKRLIRSILPQSALNRFYHLPKAILANTIYHFPAKRLKVIGVTGTDGKTTTVNMIYKILKLAGKKASMISTIGACIGGKNYDTGFHVTSPDPFMVQKFAKLAKENGDEYLVMEVTSHALDQYRVWGIKFDVGVITNITHEHLDYHKTKENYIKSKFKLVINTKFAVVNSQIRKLVGISENIITFGLSSGDFNQKQVNLKLKVGGDYNIENALAALAVAFILGINKELAKKALENFEGIAGRMEEVENKRGVKIFIDFAHTPNGLKQALKSLRTQTKGKLISLIGCEGFRDEGKRILMGEIAQKLSDYVIVTALDPRGQLDMINRQIEEGAEKAGALKDKNLFVIDDRQEAIDFAINKLAKRGDIIGIFGKGHERTMNLDGKTEIPWSDKEAATDVLGS